MVYIPLLRRAEPESYLCTQLLTSCEHGPAIQAFHPEPELDPGCPPALHSGLRLLHRCQAVVPPRKSASKSDASYNIAYSYSPLTSSLSCPTRVDRQRTRSSASPGTTSKPPMCSTRCSPSQTCRTRPRRGRAKRARYSWKASKRTS